MELVPQLTPFTCAPACLESYFVDINYRLDQCQILKKYPQYCTNPDPAKVHEFGSMSVGQIIEFCRHLNFKVGDCCDFRQEVAEPDFKKWLEPEKSVLICSYWNGKSSHCVRLSEVKSPGVYKVMNPSFGSAEWSEVTFDELVEWQFRFLLIGK
jgi:hypothetical protein